MRKIIILLVFICLFNPIFSNYILLAQPVVSNIALNEPVAAEGGDGRYVLLMMKGRALQNTRVPALVLDTAQGIVWTCQSLQDDRPLWIKTDVGQNENKPLAKKKYIARILEWQEANLRVPAVILDIDEGKAWTCSDIIDSGDTWMQTDFKNISQKEIRGAEIKY